MPCSTFREPSLLIDAVMTSATNDDTSLWDQATTKVFGQQDFSTPTTVDVFFESDSRSPSFFRTSCFGDRTPPTSQNTENISGRLSWNPPPTPRGVIEPSMNPCTDEIPWHDLVYWLGDSSTGEVECSCASCSYEHRPGCTARYNGGKNYIAYPSLSSKIPVVRVPRIEGVN